MEETKERLARLEEQVKQIGEIKELRKDIQTLTLKVADNSIASKIGKAILWLATTTGIAYFLQYIKG